MTPHFSPGVSLSGNRTILSLSLAAWENLHRFIWFLLYLSQFGELLANLYTYQGFFYVAFSPSSFTMHPHLSAFVSRITIWLDPRIGDSVGGGERNAAELLANLK
jgi:hypothetical protein